MGRLLDGYGKVDGKFPVDGYAATFWLCFWGMVVGTACLFFTVESYVQKKAPQPVAGTPKTA
jgi:hypothetical protein